MIPLLTNNISDPKKRQIWLKIWFDKLEAAELTNSHYFEVTEEDELDDDEVSSTFYAVDSEKVRWFYNY